MFKDALKEIVDRSDRGIAALLMDSSGIALESYAKDNASFDINMVGIEYSVVVGSVKRAAAMLEAGGAQEMAIATDKLTTIIRCLGDAYFVALAVEPDGNLGKGRFALRLAAPKLLADL